MKRSSINRRLFCGFALTAAVSAQAQVANLGDAINKAGRQRMLSQRMAEFYLAKNWNVDAAVSQREMTKARDEFVPALEILRNAPEATAEIKQELQLADNQWLFFDNALKSNTAGAKAATDVFVTSENLLQVMDRVTGMYAKILG